MRRSIIIFVLFLFSMSACHDDSENLLTAEIGTVVDFAGTGNCGIVIELDNGKLIQPLYFPEGFIFSAGQRVLVEYFVLSKVLNSCNEGIPCEVSYVEELSCAAYVDLDLSDYDSLERDPVHIHEAFIDGDCLYFKLSHSGGCRNHTIDLARIHTGENDENETTVLEIRHNANDDLCEAWITREFRFDISKLREENKSGFQLLAPLNGGEVYTKTFELNSY